MICPCGKGRYDVCCKPFHDGTPAPTPEQLMRSRYSAFARGLTAYLLATWHPTTRPKALVLDPEQEWLGLQVLGSTGGFLATEGTVEFRATWRQRGVTDVLHENSRFVREGDVWRYVDGVILPRR